MTPQTRGIESLKVAMTASSIEPPYITVGLPNALFCDDKVCQAIEEMIARHYDEDHTRIRLIPTEAKTMWVDASEGINRKCLCNRVIHAIIEAIL